MTAREKAYIDWLAHQPCVSCRDRGVEIAHVEAVVSRKTMSTLPRRNGASIIAAVPLCPACHRTGQTSIHAIGERGFEREHGWPEHHLVRLAATYLAAYVRGQPWQ